MAHITATLVNSSLIPRSGDFTEFEYELSIVETALIGSPEEASKTRRVPISVKLSRTLLSMWKLDNDTASAVCFEYAKRHLQEGGVPAPNGPPLLVDLNSSTAPRECPFDPDRIQFRKGITFEITAARPMGFRKH